MFVILEREKLGFTAIDLAWAQFDTMVYFVNYETGDVYQYDVLKKRANKTSHKGIHFSQSGHYYFSSNYDGLTFGLFTNDNTEITSELRKIVGRFAIEPEPVWINQNSLLVKVRNSERNAKWIVCDLRTMKATQEVEGSPLGITSDGSRIAVYGKSGVIQWARTVDE